jgi:hypothetical protein
MHLGYGKNICKNEVKTTAACPVFTLLLHKFMRQTAEPERPWINENNMVQGRFDVHVG